MNLLEAKIYYDGSNWIAIPHTERPYRQRRPRDKPEKSERLQSRAYRTAPYLPVTEPAPYQFQFAEMWT